jgi:hypothetical protein
MGWQEDEMTAAELYELVKDCPEAWPEGLKYVDITPYGSPDRVMVWDLTCKALPEHSSHRSCISASLAADLILAGVVRKLLTLGSIEGYYGATDLIVVEVEGADELWAQGTGPTLLIAAIDAYRCARIMLDNNV